MIESMGEGPHMNSWQLVEINISDIWTGLLDSLKIAVSGFKYFTFLNCNVYCVCPT